MHLAVAAYPIDWHNRWNEYVGKLRVWVRTAVEGGAELIVFPEFAALELATLAGEDNAADPARSVEALSARLKDVDELHASLAREFRAHLCAATGPIRTSEGRVRHRARLFAPDGGRGVQDKLAPDDDERATWGVEPGETARVFDTALGRIGVLIGADVAAPGIAAAMARSGAQILLAPGRSGTAEAAAARRAAAAARARETGCVVAQAVAVGVADWAPALGRSTGAAAIFAPAVDAAPDDAALAEGKADAPGWVQADVAPSVAPRSVPASDGEAWAVEVVELGDAGRRPPPG